MNMGMKASTGIVDSRPMMFLPQPHWKTITSTP